MIRLLFLAAMIRADQLSCGTMHGIAGTSDDPLSCCSSLDNVVTMQVVRIRAEGDVVHINNPVTNGTHFEVSVVRTVNETFTDFVDRAVSTTVDLVNEGISPFDMTSVAYVSDAAECEDMKNSGIPTCYYTANSTNVGNFY